MNKEPDRTEKLKPLMCNNQIQNCYGHKAAESHSDVKASVKKVANEDTVHRKIFVHGLGWDATAETLRNAFSQYGEIEDCKAVSDKISGKSKGYGFILFKTRAGARRALKQPQKKIGNRMTACQLAAVGPVPSSTSSAQATPQQPVSEYTQRKIYVSNVSADLDPQKLTAFFSKYGEIEEGPLGLDKQTGKPKGFCLFVYKSIESAKKALEEPHKHFEGHVLHCQKAIDGPKPGKQQQNQGRGQQQYGRNDNPNLAGAIGGPPATGAGLMGQSVGGVPFNHGAAAAPALNPALGQALTALLASQGAGLGLNNLLGTLGSGIGATAVAPGGHGIQGGYGSQAVAGGGITPAGVLSGYGTQGGLQAAYPSQHGQGGASRSQHGHMGGVAPYTGH
ncbi:hypothetical protein Cgig2_001370 [Carnegiea gigantea]|uniref:RRM domain-containing protein n=1 Tax=Carnegiea gigantea TaxID=171969 RepID=A0A9Q1QPU4_9CARY|nr:hypothetical protein Cgig2_001370 [Carnegiea gigantea]